MQPSLFEEQGIDFKTMTEALKRESSFLQRIPLQPHQFPTQSTFLSDSDNQRASVSYMYNLHELSKKLGFPQQCYNQEQLNSITCDCEQQIQLIIIFIFSIYLNVPDLLDRDTLRETLNDFRLFETVDALGNISDAVMFNANPSNFYSLNLDTYELLNAISHKYWLYHDVDIFKDELRYCPKENMVHWPYCLVHKPCLSALKLFSEGGSLLAMPNNPLFAHIYKYMIDRIDHENFDLLVRKDYVAMENFIHLQ
ncbi:hypothetical protein PCE1_002383 [Barthelona sp. PCE]